jgi:hypothetical protein
MRAKARKIKRRIFMITMKNSLKLAAALALSAGLMACGGGGGGGGSSSNTLYYPYETVYGDVCVGTLEASPGCTFDRATGARITVSEDPHYDRFFGGSDDMYWVEFDSNGIATVYTNSGAIYDIADVSEFAGWVGGTQIGVGTTGLFWEDIRNGSYWLGKNGVLYNAMPMEGNYGEAINNDDADEATDTNFAAINSDGNKKLVKLGADKLVKEYGFKADKAHAVASALNVWAVAGVERGMTTTRDISQTFQTVFGVDYNDALASVKAFVMKGNSAAMQDLTNRSSSALGLKPHQTQKFMKEMYRKALAEWGYDVDNYNW